MTYTDMYLSATRLRLVRRMTPVRRSYRQGGGEDKKISGRLDSIGCQAVCNGDDDDIDRGAKDCAAGLGSLREMRMHRRSLQSLGVNDGWNPPANRVSIDSRGMKMILPKDADRG